MEEYYQTIARDWERYALIKARVAAGDKRAGQALLNTLRPFVYRRYLDYNAFESLRTMKELIDQETRRKGWENNIKLGSGGIREIEFICQAFQLIRGGRQPALQQQHLLVTLQLLEKYQLLPQDVVLRLREAYIFLRCTENRLQAIEDRQIHTLPQDVLLQTRLIYSMGFEDWRQFTLILQRHQESVHHQFELVVKPVATKVTHTNVSPYWQTLWQEGLQEETQAESLSLLTKAKFQDAEKIWHHLRQFAHSYSVYKLSKRGRERLDKLIPLLLTIVCKHERADDALHRILDLIESVAQRSVYLSLLIERTQVLELLVNLCADSVWITEQITRYPLLLDELLDPRRLYDPLKPEELDNALQAQLAHLPIDDLEMQMDSMRQFKRAYVLQVATAEIAENLTVEVASDYLAAIADTLTRSALAIAWDYLAQNHGQPVYTVGDSVCTAGFCIVAYGKAGGIELSYDSDLDIVFLHDSQGTQTFTNGDKSLDNSVFFSRLARRIIHILSTNTPAGILYEVDPRLRPGGNSGLLVSSLNAFEAYQQESAWTWEHQALVRARVIAGNTECQAQFEKMRREILSQRRDPTQLKKDVYEMRLKMRDHLNKSTAEQFDIKQGEGGIADIEFLTQYFILNWAADHPKLLETTGTLPALRLLSQHQLLEETACQQLSEAYRAYRAENHRLALQNLAAFVAQDQFSEHRQQVTHWWEHIMTNH
jgi:glutamate-ammonia-ligase adenylyltransferase